MTVVEIEPVATPEDVLRLEQEQDRLYELVDGQLIEKTMSELANETAGLVGYALIGHARPGNLGRILPEQSFQCFLHNPGRIRRPDISFILATRLTEKRFAGHIPIRPDIAVEVVSPNDNALELERKLRDYRCASLPLTWVIYPETRTMLIHRADGTTSRLSEQDMLTGETVLPGFTVKVADLLPMESVEHQDS